LKLWHDLLVSTDEEETFVLSETSAGGIFKELQDSSVRMRNFSMMNTRRTRLLALDVDGTLLTDDYQITAATRAAIQQVTSHGVQVVLASARGQVLSVRS